MEAAFVDVLIPLGDGSRWRNNELRYALRSIERHLSGVGRVFVVGDDPGFLSNQVTFVPFEDDAKINKEARIAAKILWACRNLPDLAEEFLFANDDHFFLQNVDATAYPFYFKGPLRKAINRNMGSTYQRSLTFTFDELGAHGIAEPLHYDIHTPIRYRKSAFVGLEDWWRRSSELSEGFVVKSIYGNVLGVGGEQMHDCKISRPLGREQLERTLKDRHVFSIADTAIKPSVEPFLRDRFPGPSRFER